MSTLVEAPPPVLAGGGRVSAGVERVTLRLSGLHCAACGGLIEHALRAVPGVETAQVQPAALRAAVDWRPAVPGSAPLIDAIRQAGYDATEEGAADAADLQRKATRRALWQTFVALFCAMQIMMLATPAYVAAAGDLEPDLARLLAWAQWVLTLPVMAFAAGPFLGAAWSAARHGRVAMELPVALGIVVAFGASTLSTFDPGGPLGDALYFDSVTMFIGLLMLARWLQLRAQQKATLELERRAAALPALARRVEPDGRESAVPPQQLRPGDLVRVAVGEVVAADGVIVAGETHLDESMLSGESRPVSRRLGEAVACGSLNLSAPIQVRVERAGAQTRLADIVRLMQQALTERPASLRQADRWAAPFTVAVLLAATAAALAWGWFAGPAAGIRAAVAVLIVTCPCALALAVPTAQLAATAAAARRGLLVKCLDGWDRLAQVDTVVLDKTGTLTDPRALDLIPVAMAADASSEEMAAAMSRAASLAAHSTHPLSSRVADTHRASAAGVSDWSGLSETASSGVSANDAQGARWALGSAAWAVVPPTLAAASPDARLWLSRDGQPLLRWDSSGDTLRPDAPAALADWHSQGLGVHVLSGDTAPRVAQAALALGVKDWSAGVSPQGKRAAVAQLQAAGRKVLMLGDGLNDAPVLAQADAAIACGDASHASRHAADAVLLSGRLADASWACRHARQTQRVLRQNLIWAAAYNAMCVPLALAGLLPPLLAGLGMAASSAAVALNSMRLIGRTRGCD